MRALKLLSVLFFVVVVLGGCGGGGAGTTTPAVGNSTTTPPTTTSLPTTNPPTTSNPTSNYVRLQSDQGDFVGQGKTYLYTPDVATISLAGSGSLISITVHGAIDWTGSFKAPDSTNQFAPGTYSSLKRYPFHDPAVGGLDWGGGGRGCNTLLGSITIDKISYIYQTISSVDMHFEQHCEGAPAALRGEIHWVGDPATLPIGATPPGTWQPPMGIAPSNMANYVYLDSDVGDSVGGGWKYGYTQADSVFSVTTNAATLLFSVKGDENWTGVFYETDGAGQLRTGYIGNMHDYPPLNIFTWFGGWGTSCSSQEGWYIIDKATYAGGALTELDIRFEQQCTRSMGALHGAIHWASSDTTAPPGPVNPPPAGLWQPPAGSTPATGNFAYFESDPGDFVGIGQNYLYTPVNSRFTFSAPANYLNWLYMNIDGDLPWNGLIVGMNSMSQLQPGYYPGVLRAPAHNPVKGGVSWGGDMRGCNQSYGWFAIDNVNYTAGALTAIDLRFEQHCEGAAQALHGAIHWTSTDTTLPPGPVNPPPANLWVPPAGSIPASGNYIYLQSQPGNYVSQGQTYLYTPSNATVTSVTTGNYLHFDIAGPNHWTGNFGAMYFLNNLIPGYYEVNDANYHNPVRGSMYWNMDSYACGNPTGWFVVDNVTYVNGAVSSIDARFMQLCVLETVPLYGAIHWVF